VIHEKSINPLIKAVMSLSVFVIVLAIFTTAASSAKPDRIENIRKLYKKAGELECETGCEQFSNKIILNTMVPGIGLQTTVISFTYTSIQKAPEDDPYLLAYILHKVTVTYNIAASEKYRLEYLYDEKEEPVFYYWKRERPLDNTIDEKRYYFQDQKLIMAKVDMRSPSPEKGSYSVTAGFQKGDIHSASTAVSQAKQYRSLFKKICEAGEMK